MARHKLRQTMERKILSVRRHWGRGTQSDRGNHTNGNSVDNLLHATRRGNNVGSNSSRQCGKPPAKVATTTSWRRLRSMMLPLLLLLLLLDCCCCWRCLPPSARALPLYVAKCTTGVHCPCANWSGFIANGCNRADVVRPTAAPSCLRSPIPHLLSLTLCLVEAIKLHFEAAQKFA